MRVPYDPTNLTSHQARAFAIAQNGVAREDAEGKMCARCENDEVPFAKCLWQKGGYKCANCAFRAKKCSFSVISTK